MCCNVGESILKEKYLTYKLEYREYILLLKSGNFYISLNNDAIVINSILKYKIKEINDQIKTGFPLNSLNKVLLELDKKEVNYLIIDEDIVIKQKFKNNNYLNYQNNIRQYLSRINNAVSILKNNLNNPKIEEIISELESTICKINY